MKFVFILTLTRRMNLFGLTRFRSSLSYVCSSFFILHSISLPDHTVCVCTTDTHIFFFHSVAIENNVDVRVAHLCLRLTQLLSDGFIAIESQIKY